MRTLLLFLTLLVPMSIYSQDITGTWNGVLDAGGQKIRMIIHISKDEKGYVSTMDSPDQGAKGLPVAATTFENSKLTLKITNFRAEYVGELNSEGKIVGTFSQGGANYPITLTKGEIVAPKRPQEPKPPFSYYSEDLKFFNQKAKINLAGTLTLPTKEGKYPVVVLITGSGQQNRNEEILEHKPFLVLADYLAKKGIGVLRFDDRGVGESEGRATLATATSADFATDVESAVAYLKTRKEVIKSKIGLIGHSEGGMIAPMVAANSKDIAFIVLLAGSGVAGSEVLVSQNEAINRASGLSEIQIKELNLLQKGWTDLVKKSTNPNTLESELFSFLKNDGMDEKRAESQAKSVSSPWMQFFIKYDPAINLMKLKCPVLALNGEKDTQVVSKINLPAIKSALAKGGNKSVTIKELPKMNHLFQECETGLLAEYGTIEQTFSPIALKEISDWLIKITK
jgi:uncharacterized protein